MDIPWRRNAGWVAHIPARSHKVEFELIHIAPAQFSPASNDRTIG
jgi:hypothetical protein